VDFALVAGENGFAVLAIGDGGMIEGEYLIPGNRGKERVVALEAGWVAGLRV
jgi:hypothetical protein